ncbi:TPA: alanine racemase [Enterobacter hormaechei subsp. xiangfangensis]|nr:alanine racemase [Enterobacter hormaechei subsp. xiangfangensis]HAV1890639.1 alanine racemase [Enterobacter hormaechei subsp. xiangfangensis]
MAKIATANSMGSGHAGFPPNPPVTNEPFMTDNGIPVLVDGTMFAPHTDGHTTHTGIGQTSRPWFTVNGKGILTEGDSISCGETIILGGFVEIA